MESLNARRVWKDVLQILKDHRCQLRILSSTKLSNTKDGNNKILDDLKNLKLEEIGSIIENYKYFPNKTNVEFVKVMNRNKIKVMVWERGVGRTLGCGTGACSATVVSILKNYINNEVVVELEGGIVKVKYDVDTNSVILMGNAEKVFKGEIDIWNIK